MWLGHCEVSRNLTLAASAANQARLAASAANHAQAHNEAMLARITAHDASQLHNAGAPLIDVHTLTDLALEHVERAWSLLHASDRG